MSLPAIVNRPIIKIGKTVGYRSDFVTAKACWYIHLDKATHEFMLSTAWNLKGANVVSGPFTMKTAKERIA